MFFYFFSNLFYASKFLFIIGFRIIEPSKKFMPKTSLCMQLFMGTMYFLLKFVYFILGYKWFYILIINRYIGHVLTPHIVKNKLIRVIIVLSSFLHIRNSTLSLRI